ncbi:MAG: DUF58 domain-containing protein [Gammaproteobacteria bacterium]|nr:DUF58 domain-containing protein [Gammaproteobacteria bacterium]MDH5628557.1 DUF58 domain-containing protein [Gammaproteobacteria bacterium]
MSDKTQQLFNSEPITSFKGVTIDLDLLMEMRYQSIIPWITPDSRVKTSRVGGFRSKFKGRGMDFDEVRLYQMGDDIRNIDWKVTARTGNTHTKLFKEERERPVFVILDQMPGMFFGTKQSFKAVVAAQIAAQLMWYALTNGDRFGALMFTQQNHIEMKPSNNRRNCMRLLNRIIENHQMQLESIFDWQGKQTSDRTNQIKASSTEKSKVNPLTETIKRIHYLAKPGSLIHLISDFNLLDEEGKQLLTKVSQHTDIHCIMITDEIEQQLPPAGNYGISDGKQQSILQTSNLQFRNDYEQLFALKKETVKRFALNHKGVFTHVDTDYKSESIGQQLAASARRAR